MTPSNLKVLIIDDNVFKANDIRKALEFCGVRNVTNVWDQESAWEEIERADQLGRPFGLVVTDMHYPVKKGEDADWRAGEIFLEEVQRRGMSLPVIVCSSMNLNLPLAYGCVWYSSLNENMEFDFQALLNTMFRMK